MNEIDSWFEQTERRSRQPVSLYSCLLTGRIFTYFGYRLRYPFLIATVRFAVHVAEFFILLSSLGGVAAFTVMVLRAGSLIVAGGWWGLLEVMRERLRTFARTGQRDSSELEIGRWLVLSAFVGLGVTAAGAAAVMALSPSGDPLARVYAFLIVIELAIDFPVRVLHSGIYATRRVYKPIWSMFVPTVVQLAILGIGFFFYPAAAMIIAIIVSNAIGIWITVHFCLEVYRLMGLRPRFGSDGWRFWRHLPSIPPWLGLETTLSGLSFRLDAFLVLALVGFYGTDTRTFDLTAGFTSWRNIDAFQFFYLIMPLFRGTYDSAGIFYFDLVRLRSVPAMRELQLLFFRKLLWVAPVIGLYFWTLAAGLGLVVLRDVPISFLLALIPLFVLRSMIGAYQMRLFAEGRFGTHISTLLLLTGLLWLVWINPNPAGDLVQITAAMIVQLIVLINLQHLRDRRTPELPTLVSLRDWTTSLSGEPGPALVGTITMPDSTTPKQKSAVASLAAGQCAGVGRLAFKSPGTLVYYKRATAGQNGLEDYLTLQTMTGGAGGRGRAVPAPATDGRAALDAVLGWMAPAANLPPQPQSSAALIEAFRTLFPTGVVFDVQTLDGAVEMRSLDEGVLAAALPAAVAGFDSGAEVIPVAGRLLTPLYEGGVLRLLFILPDNPEPGSCKRWLGTLKAWHLGPAAPGTVMAGG